MCCHQSSFCASCLLSRPVMSPCHQSEKYTIFKTKYRASSLQGAYALFLHGTWWSVLWALCLELLVNASVKSWVLVDVLMFLFLLPVLPNIFFLLYLMWWWSLFFFPFFGQLGQSSVKSFHVTWSIPNEGFHYLY